MAQKVIQCEDEDAKILMLKSIMSETLIGEVGAFDDRPFGTNADLFAVIIRYLSNKKVDVNDEIRLASISTILVQDLVEREVKTSSLKIFFLSWFVKAKTRKRVRTKTKEFVGTTKNCHHSIGCSNDKQNTWTEAMLLERSTGLKV